MTAPADYTDRLEEIRASFDGRIRALLAGVCNALTARGATCTEVFADSDEEFRWSFGAQPRPDAPVEALLDVAIVIEESVAHAGEGAMNDGGNGLNFSLSVVGSGGEVVGGFTPHNYTPRVWVDVHDVEAIEARWEEFAAGVGVGLVDCAESCQEFWGQQEEKSA